MRYAKQDREETPRVFSSSSFAFRASKEGSYEKHCSQCGSVIVDEFKTITSNSYCSLTCLHREELEYGETKTEFETVRADLVEAVCNGRHLNHILYETKCPQCGSEIVDGFEEDGESYCSMSCLNAHVNGS